MTKIQSIISSTIILIVVFASILQFHHHDQSGMICLVTENTHTLVGDNSFSNHNNEHCCETPEDHHKNDDENCSLKISIAKANKSFSFEDHQFVFVILHNIVSLCLIDETTIIQEFNIRDNNLTLPESYTTSNQLRAPPTV